MPIEKDVNHGGTNQDGSKSSKYCSLCYSNGKFHDTFTSSKEMVSFVKEQLKKQGFSSLKRWFFTSHIPQLERWKK